MKPWRWFSGALIRVHPPARSLSLPHLTVVVGSEKITRRQKNHLFSSSFPQIMVGSRKTYLACFHTPPSLCKLTAHHKSISAWRKSISRLLTKKYFSSKKKRKKTLQSSCGEGKSNRIKKERRRSEGGGSKRIFHPLFGQQLCPNEVWPATTEVFR